MLHAEEDAAQQHGERVVPVLDARLCDRPEHAADAGVVEHAVQASEVRERRVEHRLHLGLVGDVGPDEADPVAVAGVGGGRERALGVRFVDVRDHHLRAFAQEAQRRFGADAVGAAGDHRYLARQSHRVSSAPGSPTRRA